MVYIVKISGVKACQAIRKQYNKDYVSLMLTNLYGSNDILTKIFACVANDVA